MTSKLAHNLSTPYTESICYRDMNIQQKINYKGNRAAANAKYRADVDEWYPMMVADLNFTRPPITYNTPYRYARFN